MLLKDCLVLYQKLDVKKNKEFGIDIDTITTGSMKKIWWKCDKGFNHSYDKTIKRKREHQNSCPICSGQRVLVGFNDLLTTCRELVEKEWDYERNDEKKIYPTNITKGSGKKACWKCEFGHRWEAVVASRTGDYKRGCPICSHNKLLEGYNDFASNFPGLLKEWDYQKNNELGVLPNTIPPNSRKRVWWLCTKCGNSYKAAPSYRIHGTGCPKCANELTSSFPEQAIYYYLKKYHKDTMNRAKIDNKEVDIFIPSLKIGIEYDGIRFHKGENAARKEQNKYETLKKNDIYLIRVKEKGSNIEDNVADSIVYIKPQHNDKELTICIKDLVELINKQRLIHMNTDLVDVSKDRTEIYKQYIRIQKSNNLEILRPELVKEWNFIKNGNLKPKMFTINSDKKVWWKCKRGHEWEAYISNRATKNVGCPICAGKKVQKGFNDLESLFPEVAKEWDYEKNGELKPYDVTYGSEKKAWFKCSNGHSYKTSPNKRTSGKTGCPVCAGQIIMDGFNDLKTKCPEILKEWDYEKNDKLGIYPNQVGTGYGKKVWWKCDYDHEWQAMIHSRVGKKHAGCPECATIKRKA